MLNVLISIQKQFDRSECYDIL